MLSSARPVAVMIRRRLRLSWPVDCDLHQVPPFQQLEIGGERGADAAQTLFKALSDGGRTHAVDLVLIAPQMLAGMEAGWTQSFDKLQELAAGG